MQFFDTVALDGAPRRTAAGYLVADVRIARTGIQTYAGREVGRPEMPVVRVMRPESEVFADRSMATFAHRPVTVEHPGVMVDASNWKQFGVGSTGDSVARDGQFLRVPMTMMDQGAINAWEAGKRELSAGYTCDLDWTPGTTEAGEAFDAVQRNIVANHLAVVDSARAGPACRVGDADPQATPSQQNTGNRIMADTPLKTVVVDGGFSIDTNDAGQASIQRLLDAARARTADAVAVKDAAMADAARVHAAAIAAKDAEMGALVSAHTAALATKDAALGTAAAAQVTALEAKDAALGAAAAEYTTALAARDGEIAALRTKVPDAAMLDAMLAERLDVFAAARTVLGDGYDVRGKGVAEVKRAALVKVMGEDVASKPDAYIDAAFDAVTKVKAGDAAHDPLRAALAGSGFSDAAAVPGVPNAQAVTDSLQGFYEYLKTASLK